MELILFDERWLPKSVLCLRDYSLNKFLHDLLAGITVGLVALPLALAQHRGFRELAPPAEAGPPPRLPKVARRLICLPRRP